MNKRKSKKILALFLSFQLIALAIAGAFAVQVKKANASPSNTIYTWSDLADLVYDIYPNNEIIESWFAYFGNDDSINNPIGINIFNSNRYLVLCALGSEPSEIAITVWRWNIGAQYDIHPDGWTIFQNRDVFGAGNSSGYVLYREGFFYSDISGYNTDRTSRSYNLNSPTTNVFEFGVDSQVYYNNQTVFPNKGTFFNGHYTVLTSRPLYQQPSSVITYEQTLIGAPISAYNNVCFTYGEQYYFTFSDQSILQTFVSEQSSNIVPITFNKGGQLYTFNYSMDELVYTGRTSVSGVTNVGSGGVLAWNLTPMINQWYFDSVVHSHVEPAGVYRDYFANNEAIISWAPVTDPAAQYEYYLSLFQESIGHNYVANPNELPSYITSGNVGFSQEINAHVIITGSSAGYVYFDSVAGQHAYDVNVPPSSILIIDSYMLENDFDASGLGSESFDSTFSGYLKDDVDLIIVVENWETISKNVTRWYMGPVNLPDSQIMSTQDCDYFKHHSYYQDWDKSYNDIHFYFTKGIEDNFIPNEGINSFSGFVFATNRYYSRICNAILAEGFNALQNALDNITNNENTFFTGMTNGIASLIAAINTGNGKLQNLYDYFKYEIKFSDKLESILDKLDRIGNNTDVESESNGFWIIPLYNFINSFAPSESDFTNAISEIQDTYEELPDIPSTTPIVIPNITLPGG